MLPQLNREANAACKSDAGGDHHWNCGVYVFREKEPGEDDAGASRG
jgi:hypothetical protein